LSVVDFRSIQSYFYQTVDMNPTQIAPTYLLPPVKKIPLETLETLNVLISYLRALYNPEVRGSRQRQKPFLLDERIASAVAHKPTYPLTADLNRLRADLFERTHSIRWLTALIFALNAADDDETTRDSQEKDKTIQNAAALLALLAGPSASGTIARNFEFTYYALRSSDFEPFKSIPVSITITDLPLNNNDFGSVGVQTWGSACVMSEMLVQDPGAFGISSDQFHNRKQSVFRILELGAGTGLVTLTTAKLLQKITLDITCRIQIVATDYHPSALENLRANVRANIHADENTTVTVTIHSLDWSQVGPGDTRSYPFTNPFDLVFGADVIYEPEHAKWIHSCLTYLLRKPSQLSRSDYHNSSALFHLVSPLRATHSSESNYIETIFSRGEDDVDEPLLHILTKEIFACDTEMGEEVEYAYYKIGWA